MTQQRRAILSVIETARKHLDAAQILRKAQKIDDSVDRSTVYRTLRLLKRQGLIDELDLMHINGEGHYYERKLERDHIHMACLRCGKITEFVSDSFESSSSKSNRIAGSEYLSHGWRLADTARRAVDRSRVSRYKFRKKKRPDFSVEDARQGSPPPELPNHEMDIRSAPNLCKRNLGNFVSAELMLGLTEVTD